ncbi:DNA-binding response OmpR family regulator [Variovorax boronicumulans]|uniref:response regulator transcription factor n=1 Tax=Variovorax boronicumulans TaxID=436515 RepID=UPI00247352D3|nr:response regulator [Variovorax boronicumulans]MDH6167130.1 DNA-binding response OmpR family regulator [Variovorax boronicumulans]
MPNIAVVDDDRSMNAKLKGLLEQIDGAVVFQAYSLEEAGRLISKGQFDLLVLDIDLGSSVEGRLGGMTLLREYGAQMTTIIVSGVPEAHVHQDIALTQLKAFEFINKPMRETDFIHKVRHALTFGVSAENQAAASAKEWPKDLTVQAHPRAPNLEWKGKPVPLTQTELGLTYALAAKAGSTVTHAELEDALKTGTSIAAHIANVRKRFREIDPIFDQVGTTPGKGYFWKADAT